MPSLSDILSGNVIDQGVNSYLNAPITAAGIQAKSQQQATDLQKYMFNRVVGQEQPFIQAGYGATKGLNELFGANGSMNKGYGRFNFDPNSVYNDPGYQFQLKQGDRALQSSDATTVGAPSGAAMKDLIGFNQGLTGQYEQQYYNQALQKYQANQSNYYTNQNNIFNRLNQIAAMGQNAAGNLGTNSTQLGTGIAQSIAATGAAQAGGVMGQANNMATAASGIGSLIAAFV